MKTEALFIELLQVAVGRREFLSHTPSEQDWQTLYSMASKQAVLGVCFLAVQRLHSLDQVPPKQLVYEWFGVAESIRQRNEVVNKHCRKIQRKLTEAGIRSSILKGQAVAQYYGQELSRYRQSGDIDVYVDCGLEGVLKFARDNGIDKPTWDYKHLHLDLFHDTEVEVHYRVEVLLNLWKNRKLQKWFKDNEELLFQKRDELITPTTAFNQFYVLLHIYRHFLYEGVGMRQLMDYYYVLTARDANDRPFNLERVLKQFGMWRFARGIMWVMQEVFALDRAYMVGAPLESEGRFILKEVMTSGNFGHYDERINNRKKGKLYTVAAVCKHNIHLLQHYPSEVMWPPVWFVWHKCWKQITNKKLRDNNI